MADAVVVSAAVVGVAGGGCGEWISPAAAVPGECGASAGGGEKRAGGSEAPDL